MRKKQAKEASVRRIFEQAGRGKDAADATLACGFSKPPPPAAVDNLKLPAKPKLKKLTGLVSRDGKNKTEDMLERYKKMC